MSEAVDSVRRINKGRIDKGSGLRPLLCLPRNPWSALNRYVEDGDLSFGNNFADCAHTPIVIGR